MQLSFLFLKGVKSEVQTFTFCTFVVWMKVDIVTDDRVETGWLRRTVIMRDSWGPA